MAEGLGNFELMSRVASDHLGEVWKARRFHPETLVRVRIVTSGALNAAEVQPRLVDEILKAFGIKSGGLIPPVEVGIDNGRVYIVTDWPEGSTLSVRLRRDSRIPERDALRLVAEASAALEEAWTRQGMIHGHLVPDSFNLWPEGRIQILDLGQSGVVPLRAAQHRDRDVLRLLRSVPFYTAPEMVRGAAGVDFRTDVYSLGAILYHALTGAAPFADSPAAEALDKHLMGMVADPLDLNADLTPGMAWLIERMMMRDPAQRFSSWAEARAAIAAVQIGREPPGERPVPGQSVVRRGTKRDPKLAAALKPKGMEIMKTGPAPAADPATSRRPKQRIVVNDDVKQAAASVQKRSNGGVPSVVVIAVILAGFLLYKFWPQVRGVADSVQHPPPPPAGGRLPGDAVRRPADAALPPPAPSPEVDLRPFTETPRPRPRPSPAKFEATAIEIVEPAAAPPANGEPAAPADPMMSHPAFRRGAAKFNNALGLFKQFQALNDIAPLKKIPAICEEAAKDFEECEKALPGDHRVRKYIEQCYGLARYARQSEIMAGGLRDVPSGPTPRDDRTPVLPAPPSSVGGGVTRALPSPAAPVVSPNDGLKLAPGWNTPVRAGSSIVRELRDLLEAHGRPAADLSPKADVRLDPRVGYLAKLEEASKALGVTVPSGTGTDVISPGFPDRSLRYYDFDTTTQPGYGKGRMIVDTFGHVVAMQWINDQPAAEFSLPEEMFSAKWSICDPIAGRIRERPTQRIAHRVRSSEGVVRIETELGDPGAAAGQPKSISRYSLTMPQPLVDLMLMRMSTAQ